MYKIELIYSNPVPEAFIASIPKFALKIGVKFNTKGSTVNQ